MMHYQEVTRFFDLYKQYVRDIWSLDEPEGQLTYEGYGNEEYRICSPGVSSDELRLASSLLPDNLVIPEILTCFWSQYRFLGLGVPLVSFYPTEEEDFQNTTMSVIRSFSPLGFAPFATDESGAVSFCFDLRGRGTVHDSSIVLLRAGVEIGETVVVGPVFSSFAHLLRIMAETMDASETFYWEDSPSKEQRALVQKFKVIDPDGFGGTGWRSRWSQWFADE